MSRYIDADALLEWIKAVWDLDSEWINEIKATAVIKQTISDIEHEPTADVVEVVRCKDCKHWSKEFEACYIHDFCEIFQSDYYCASGERKEDGETLEHNKEDRHGQWIICEPIHMHSICSCCGYYNAYNPYYKYCPDCGAKMDEREDEE